MTHLVRVPPDVDADDLATLDLLESRLVRSAGVDRNETEKAVDPSMADEAARIRREDACKARVQS
ncbi:hypothetical protein [Tautonia plasticadhaerens]|uniref:hypothetical protein n=1 Tax=Tautonia plasticadhaerens TaxID=2527974 RepID=UPI00119F33A3|nr:hypothetical protein [Tautonia plasticadhaerens]